MDKVKFKNITWDLDQDNSQPYFSDKRAAIAGAGARYRIHKIAADKAFELLVTRNRDGAQAAVTSIHKTLEALEKEKGFVAEGKRLACQMAFRAGLQALEGIYDGLKKKAVKDKKAMSDALRQPTSGIHLKHSPFAALRGMQLA